MRSRDLLRQIAPKIEKQIDALELSLAMMDIAFETTWRDEESADLKKDSFNVFRIFVVSSINSLFQNAPPGGVRSIFHEEYKPAKKEPSVPVENDTEKRILRIIRTMSKVRDCEENEIIIDITSLYNSTTAARIYNIKLTQTNKNDDEDTLSLHEVEEESISESLSAIEEIILSDICSEKSELHTRLTELNDIYQEIKDSIAGPCAGKTG